MFEPKFIESQELVSMGFKKIGKNVLISDTCTIFGKENIEIGDNVRIDGYCTLIANGSGYIKLGSNIHIGAYSLLVGGAGIVMEDFSGLSQGCKLYSRSDDYSGRSLTNPTVPEGFSNVISGEIVLKKHVIIGSSSVILPAVTVGEGSAVGALSMLTKNINEWEIVSGVPARKIKNRRQDLLEYEKRYLEVK